MAPSAPDSATAAARARRRRVRWIKWGLLIVLAVVLTVEGIILWPQLHESWKKLTEIHWGWVAAAIAAEAVSFSGFARVQKQLLHSGGVEISQGRSLAVVYASNSMSVTLPAGSVFATAFSYRQLRRYGASPLVASWELAVSGIIGVAGLAILGVGGAALVGSKVSPWTLIFSVLGIVALVLAGNYAATHPDGVQSAGRWLVTRFNRIRGHDDDDGWQRVTEIAGQLEAVKLNRRDAALTFIWTLGHRVGDVACLGFACHAVGADPAWGGLMVAFAVGKAIGTIPGMPGGLGYLDAALFSALTFSAGLPFAQAVTAGIVYRIISLFLAALVGWIVFLFLFRKMQSTALDAEIDAELER